MTRSTFFSHGDSLGGYLCSGFSLVASSLMVSVTEPKPEMGDGVAVGLP